MKLEPQAMPLILIVEDNEMSRDILSRRLKKAGFEILMAENGQEAVEKAALHKPQLILMDLNLPVMDGWEAARRLKKEEATRAIPIIALTAHAMVEDLRSAIEAGCDDYDTKPIDFGRLMQKISVFLPEAKGAAHG